MRARDTSGWQKQRYKIFDRLDEIQNDQSRVTTPAEEKHMKEIKWRDFIAAHARISIKSWNAAEQVTPTLISGIFPKKKKKRSRQDRPIIDQSWSTYHPDGALNEAQFWQNTSILIFSHLLESI